MIDWYVFAEPVAISSSRRSIAKERQWANVDAITLEDMSKKGE